MRIQCRILMSLAILSGALTPVKAKMVPFVIPAEIHPRSVLTQPSSTPIAVNSPRLVIGTARIDAVPEPGASAESRRRRSLNPQTGFFQYEQRRVRLWGVNLSFGANFPSHVDALRVAARLADAGVNTVRCHHMDTASWPRGLWDPQQPTQLSPTALDRLDFFIHALAQKGIWVNLNLHVGREHSQYLGLPETPRGYDKMVNIFTPALIEAQKEFARQLLWHRNPYRQQMTYAEDPAVAFVEISNENSLFMWSAEETLRQLPPYYATLLQDLFNEWLQERYQDGENLANAWSQGIDALGDNKLNNPTLNLTGSASVPQGWRLEQHDSARARLSSSAGSTRRTTVLRVDDIQHDSTEWHLQFNQGGLRVQAGRYYTVRVDAWSDAARTISCSVGQAHSPWANLGLSRALDLTTEAQTFTMGFVATADDHNARVSIIFGQSDIPFMLERIEFRPGGQNGLLDSESLADRSVQLYQDNESVARIRDRFIFLAETEKLYFDQMYDWVKDELGCRALMTGTIVFGPLGLYGQSDMDFIDAHAYWQHPHFPGIPWDAGNWLINQKAMTAYPHEATLFGLAAKRLAGKPFTVSEYNHPAPLDSQAECVPLMASFAAAQDWDGIWFYTYSHSNDEWDREFLNSYFDIDTNPAKWGFMHAGAAIFRHGAFGRLDDLALVPMGQTPEDLLLRLAVQHQEHGSDMRSVLGESYDMGENSLLVTQVAATWETEALVYPRDTRPPALTWVSQDDLGFYGGEGPGAMVFAGHRGLLNDHAGDQIYLTSPDFAVITMTALDGRDLAQSVRLLVSACGRCENTGTVFSPDRRTVGRQWGRAPVQIEAVTASLVLPAGQWTARALRPDGTVKGRTLSIQGDVPRLELEAKHGTLWYQVTRD